MVTRACLALKVFKLHLRALKSLLQNGKPTGAKSLAPMGLWVLPAGTARTSCPSWVAEMSRLLLAQR